MKRLVFLLLSFFAFAVPSVLLADTFSYSFNDGALPADGGTFFTYISPVLISTPTTFVPLTCGANFETCTDVFLDPNTPTDLLITLNGFSPATESYVLPASFYTLGTHTIRSTTLTILDIPSASGVPEPASLLLLGTGGFGIAGIFLRKAMRT